MFEILPDTIVIGACSDEFTELVLQTLPEHGRVLRSSDFIASLGNIANGTESEFRPTGMKQIVTKLGFISFKYFSPQNLTGFFNIPIQNYHVLFVMQTRAYKKPRALLGCPQVQFPKEGFELQSSIFVMTIIIIILHSGRQTKTKT